MIGLDSILDLGTTLINKFIPDPAQQAEAKLKLLVANQTGELDEFKVQMSAIVAEASSADPWTSRARPSFLYVMYIMILLSVPVGIACVFAPDAVARFTAGMAGFLKAIPDSLWALFGVGYGGYAIARSYDKSKATS